MKINYLGYEKKYNERTGETHYDKDSYRLAVITVNTNKQSEMDLFYKIAEKAEEEGYRYDWAGGDEEYTEAFFEVEDKADYLYFKRIYMKVKRTKNETTEVEISETTAKTETAEEVVESVEETTVSETETVEETAEQEVETAEQTETEIEEAVKSGNFYAVVIAHDTNEIEELSLVYDSYSEAMKIAKYYADVYGKNNVFIGTMQTLEPKTCKWYCYNSISETTAEQTENNAESVSETYGVDVKVDTSKSNELSGTTKTLMALSPVVSEYLRQRGYIDTS